MNVSEIFENLSYGSAPENSEPVMDWLKSYGNKFGLFIDGKFTKPSAKKITSINPATNEALASISCAGKKEIDTAVEAAQKALPKWQKQSGHQRARILYALARILQKHAKALAILETLDNGKPIRESRDIDIPLAIRHFYHHAGWAQNLEEEFPNHEAHGIVGQIIPWNFPLLMLAWKIAPALAAGNCVVLKPAEQTSLSALYFASLCEQAGVPNGVINIVTGEGDTGEFLANHPKISKVAFTGSTQVGKEIRKNIADSDKALTLELGGKSAFIVFEDADLDSAIEGVVDAIWFNQGEVCCAGSRALIQESVFEKFIEKLRTRMKKLRLGNPLDKSIDMGAIVSKTQKQRIENMLEDGLKSGGSLWHDNDATIPSEGNFIAPILISDVDAASPLVQDEIFGPVLTAMTFRTPDDAVKLANNSRYGLAASIWSENINVALDLAPRIKAGVVWINTTNQFDAACGFGGYRESGIGREGGREGMLAYLKPKWQNSLKPLNAIKPLVKKSIAASTQIDETAKLYIGGKQARPDSGFAMPVVSLKGVHLGDVGMGNKKDIRNAVEVAEKNQAWAKSTAHLRAQVLYYIAENLEKRAAEFTQRIMAMRDCSKVLAQKEVQLSLERLFACAGMADKFDGHIHSPPSRQMVTAMHEPIGIMGAVAPQDYPLLGAISMVAPLLAMGNQVVLVPSDIHPLCATDLYQIFDTSDVPKGAISIVTGNQGELGKVMAEHRAMDGIWYFGNPNFLADIKAASADNVKTLFCNEGKDWPWQAFKTIQTKMLFEQATQVKNIWVPYGA